MSDRKIVRVGSRESKLAVIQAEMVMEAIEANHPGIKTELVTMKTTGDIILDRSLDKVGGKGLFVKELDRALLDGKTDITVHSLKDVPMEVDEALPLVAFSKREDPRDALILPQGVSELDFDKPFGCSSARRILQLKKIYGEKLKVELIRGNVQTRLSKVDGGQYCATMLACAGLKRLGLEDRISKLFSEEEMIPAAGQGILAVQGRRGEDYSYLDGIADPAATAAALAERAFVRTLDGGCSSPIAAFAKIEGENLTLTGLYVDEESGRHAVGQLAGETKNAEAIGKALAMKMKNLEVEWR